MNESASLQARLVGWYIAYVVGLTGLLILFDMLAVSQGWGRLGGTANTLVSILSASSPGHVYYKRTGSLPTAAFAWRMAMWFTTANVVLSVLSLLLVGGHSVKEILSSPIFWAIFGAIVLICFVATRFAFSWGAKNSKKAFEKKAAKV